MSPIKLVLVDGRNPLGETIVTVAAKRMSVADDKTIKFVATDNELRDIEDKLRSWRLDQYGLETMEVKANAVELGDIIPCLGLTIESTINHPSGTTTLFAGQGMTVRMGSTQIVSIHRRAQ